MAKIPKLESTGKLTPLSPSIRISGGAGAGKGLQDIGKVISTTALAFQKIAVENEATTADTESRRRLKELEIEATTSEDLNPQIFEQRIQAIKQETSAGMKLPLARSKFQQQFDRNSLISGFNIKRTLNSRQVDRSVATLNDNLDAQKFEFINAGSEVEKNKIILDMNSKIDERVRLGVLTAVQGGKLKKGTLKNWSQASIRSAIATNPEVAKKDITDGVFGDLTADETAKWLEVADKKIEQNKKIVEVARDTLWLNNGGKVITNLKETSVADLIDLTAAGQINPQLGSDLVAWKTDKDSPQYEDNKSVWMELAEKSVSPELDLREFQLEVGKAIANKDIQAKEGAEFVVQVQNLFDKAVAFKSRPSLKDKVVGTAIKMFGGSGLTLGSIFNMTKEFIEGVKKGGNPDELEKSADDILKKEIKNQNPSLSNFEDIPNAIGSKGKAFRTVFDGNTQVKVDKKIKKDDGVLMIDAAGNKALVFPDGTFQEVD